METNGNYIYHGDARELLHDLDDVVHCIVTDPPYGMAFKSNAAVTPEGKAMNQEIENDEDPMVALDLFLHLLDDSKALWAPEFEMYVFGAWHLEDLWVPALKQWCKNNCPELELKMQLIWDKGYPGKGDLKGNWGCGYEVIWYLKRGRKELPYRRSGIIHVDKIPAGQNIHPTEKPVALIERLIDMSTHEDELVLDFFSGSGSTSVAAQNLGRRSVAFEVKETYIIESRKRLEQKGLFA